VLRLHRLDPARRPVTLCANCQAVAGRRVLTVLELARELRPPGDRRGEPRRRGDRREPRDRRARVEVGHLLTDRRSADRRAR